MRKKRKAKPSPLDLAMRMAKLKARIASAGLEPSDMPMFAFPRAEVEEMMNLYVPYTSATQKKITVDYGSEVSILGFKGIAI